MGHDDWKDTYTKREERTTKEIRESMQHTCAPQHKKMQMGLRQRDQRTTKKSKRRKKKKKKKMERGSTKKQREIELSPKKKQVEKVEGEKKQTNKQKKKKKKKDLKVFVGEEVLASTLALCKLKADSVHNHVSVCTLGAVCA